MNGKEIKRDHERLLRNLKALQKMNGVDALSSAIGASKATWHNRMKEPWRLFSYDDLRAIAACCRVDFDALTSGYINLG